MTTLLAGMGNPILRDDAVGPRLARDLAAALGPVPGLEVLPECAVGGLALLDVLAGHDRAIVVDSVATTAGTVGAWHHLDARALRETMHLASIHDANFATVLELGRRLGVPLPHPEDIHLLVVEIDDARTFSEAMTPALEERYPALAREIIGAVRALLETPAATEVRP